MSYDELLEVTRYWQDKVWPSCCPWPLLLVLKDQICRCSYSRPCRLCPCTWYLALLYMSTFWELKLMATCWVVFP